MSPKSIALVALFAFAATSLVSAEEPAPSPTAAASPSPSAAKHRHKKAAVAASPAASAAASATPATSGGWFKKKSTPATTPAATGGTAAASPPTTTKGTHSLASITPAPGGGNGLVWVNTKSHVYHKEGSAMYGKTKAGKYMSEADAIKEGDRAAKESKPPKE